MIGVYADEGPGQSAHSLSLTRTFSVILQNNNILFNIPLYCKTAHQTVQAEMGLYCSHTLRRQFLSLQGSLMTSQFECWRKPRYPERTILFRQMSSQFHDQSVGTGLRSNTVRVRERFSQTVLLMLIGYCKPVSCKPFSSSTRFVIWSTELSRYLSVLYRIDNILSRQYFSCSYTKKHIQAFFAFGCLLGCASPGLRSLISFTSFGRLLKTRLTKL